MISISEDRTARQIAEELGIDPSELVAPSWAEETVYNAAEGNVQHVAERTAGQFSINMIRDIYSPAEGPLEVTDDAVLSWTVEHAPGIRPDEYEFVIRPDQIDELIAALTMVKEAMV